VTERVDLPLALEAVGIRAALPLLLRALPLDRVLHVLTPCAPRTPHAAEAVAGIERVTDTITRRIRLTRTACLDRALLRYALLRRKGYPASFVIGVRSGGPNGFEAHAWVTLDDEPIMERQPADYRPTFIWPRTP
jgi:hypothetical protein